MAGTNSMDTMLAEMAAQTSALQAMVPLLEQIRDKLTAAASSAPAGGSEIASDSDLDGQYGNPEIRTNPRDWSGESQKGKRYSEAPPEFLDMLAGMLEYFAQKKQGDDPKKASYDRRDAARARGWAKRLRGGWKPEASAWDEQPAGGAEPEWMSR